MKKKFLMFLGMTAFLLSGCMGKEEVMQTEQLEMSEMTEIQEMPVAETEVSGDIEVAIAETEISRDIEIIDVGTEAGRNTEICIAGTEITAVSESQNTEYIENPNNLPVLTGNETEEGLYWDSEWQHETYVEFGPDGEVYFDKYGNAYSCPVDSEGNLIIE